MSIQKDLKKEGIQIITKLDTLISNDICKSVSRRIIETFPDFDFTQDDIYKKLLEITMYRAKMFEGMSEANYYYKNSSIYFNENIEYSDIEEFAIHECIHHLQKVQDENGNLLRLGVCDYRNLKPTALALNEAAVQYTSSLIIGIEPDYEKYYGISLYTPSPSYYPLECSLLNQILFFTGTNSLFKSTLFSNDDFKNKIIELSSEKTYNTIIKFLDDILKYEEKIVILNNKIKLLNDGNSKIDKINVKIDLIKDKISKLYIKAQNTIIKEFFTSEFDKMQELEELEHFRRKLYKYSDIIGSIEGYDYFDNFYSEMMNKLEHKCNILENGGTETALYVKHLNPFVILLKKIFKTKKIQKEDS